MPRRYADWRAWLRPEPVRQPERPSAQEALVISAWNMTLEAWQSLTDTERAEKRFNFTKAPRYAG